MSMGIASGQKAGAGRAAQRGGDKGVREPNTFGRQSIHVRRLEARIAGTTHGIEAVVIREDEYEVRWLVGLTVRATRHHHRANNGDNGKDRGA